MCHTIADIKLGQGQEYATGYLFLREKKGVKAIFSRLTSLIHIKQTNRCSEWHKPEQKKKRIKSNNNGLKFCVIRYKS